ncbi:hypothetical protein [Aminipila terrae]|uniref:Carbohydrate-binding domain-containing protein n=1 Tax=Aminipila terrae TaxID=2697030 RepID=A0A6P1MHU6_9FIRM|nr:hypothetical protein [Aminipila terrae]QHI72174.1 hypothetical protein Ami3637_06950 [Aminipila terrae]
MKKRILSILLMVCMILTMMPVVALAGTTNKYGDFSVTVGDSGSAPTYEEGVLTFAEAGEYTVAMADGKTSTSNRIVITAENVTLNLNGVNIIAPNGINAVGYTALTAQKSTILNITNDSALTGGMGGNYFHRGNAGGNGISGNVIVTGTAHLVAVGGSGGPSPMFDANGGNGISGNLTVNGKVNITLKGASRSMGSGGIGITGIISASGFLVMAGGLKIPQLLSAPIQVHNNMLRSCFHHFQQQTSTHQQPLLQKVAPTMS